jgi:hypothetical protein
MSERRRTEVLEVVALREWLDSKETVVTRVRRLFEEVGGEARGQTTEEVVDRLEFSGRLSAVRGDIEELAARIERLHRVCPELEVELGPLVRSARERLSDRRPFRCASVDRPLVSGVARAIAG